VSCIFNYLIVFLGFLDFVGLIDLVFLEFLERKDLDPPNNSPELLLLFSLGDGLKYPFSLQTLSSVGIFCLVLFTIFGPPSTYPYSKHFS